MELKAVKHTEAVISWDHNVAMNLNCSSLRNRVQFAYLTLDVDWTVYEIYVISKVFEKNHYA